MKTIKTMLQTVFSFVFALALYGSPIKGLSQNSNYLYLIPLSEDAEPEGNKAKNNKTLNALFETYGVISYRQSFPGAKSERLARVCEIHATGNITALHKALQESGSFTGIEMQNYCRVACNNPVSYNDPLMYSYQGNSYTWQLDLMDAKCAWSITQGNPNVLIGICDTEFRTDHEDFTNKFAYVWNPTNWVPNCMHGTAVSSAAAANVNNNKGVAGVGNKCRIAGYVVPTPSPCSGDPWSLAWQAYQDGVKIINISWGTSGFPTGYINDILKEITENGSTVLVAAGNTNENFHQYHADIPGVINVSTVNWEDKLGPTGMARNEWVDICTPGGGGLVARGDAVNAYSPSNSTSASVPIASGVIGLMLSVNPCMSPSQIESIIKATADPIADANLYPGLYGGGRINAYEAVKTASSIKKNTYDLFIQDTDYDFGEEPSNNSYPSWKSKAIWLRNDDDNGEVHEEIDPFAGAAYVYVKVRNIGCQPSPGTDVLHVSWAKAAVNLGWPWPWNGSNPPPTGPDLGGMVGIASIPVIPAGGEAVVKVTWNNVPDPANYPSTFPGPFYAKGHFCILARVLSAADPMYYEATTGNNVAEGNVIRNNNIAQKNISIMEDGGKGLGFIQVGPHLLPSKTRLNIGNIFGEADRVFKLSLKVPDTEVGNAITADAEVRLTLDQITWQKWAAGGFVGTGIRSIDIPNQEILIGSPDASISNLAYASDEYSEVALGINFPSKAPGKEHYNYDLIWTEDATGATVGGERFEITRPASGTTSKPTAMANASAKTIQPALSPNPTTGVLTVQCPHLQGNSSISLYDNMGRKVQSNSLNQETSTIDISSLPTGIYFYQITTGREVFNGKVIKN